MEPKSKMTAEPNPLAAAASAALIVSVLGNDDILHEIFLRLGFPTCFVRAAAVCQRWLKVASDPAFLRRFRAANPPRLLGFYVTPHLRFVPRPQPPELAPVLRRCIGLRAGDDMAAIHDCRNGRVLSSGIHPFLNTHAIGNPLRPDRGLATLPSSWPCPIREEEVCEEDRYKAPGGVMVDQAMILPEDGGDGRSCTAVRLMFNDNGFWASVRELRAGSWSETSNSNLADFRLQEFLTCYNFAVLSHGKVYMIGRSKHILELDLASMSLLCIDLPEGVELLEYDVSDTNLRLSCAEDAGFYLVHVTEEFRLCVWRYRMDRSGAGNWRLVDTICLHELFDPLEDPTWLSEDAVLNVATVGDNADFVFLQVEHQLFYIHVSSRTVEKVYELVLKHRLPFVVSPLMMPWAPTRPQVMNNATGSK